MELSAVVATHNRRDILRKAITAYQNQTPTTPQFEVLVVDDDSSDGTEEMVNRLMPTMNLSIRYFRQAKRGAAAARNVGIRESIGRIILFTDDDIVPAENLVAEHLLCHARHTEPQCAVLGHITWSPEVHPTPFMRWYGRNVVVTFRDLKNACITDFRHFYTGNVSVKRDFLQEHGEFDEDFEGYGWEDLELGYRLTKAGMKLLYDPRAIGYHYQQIRFEDACRRAQRIAATRRTFEKKEAGRHFAQLEGQRNQALGRRLGKQMASWLVPLFSPLRSFMDSRIPLPAAFYQMFYWYYGARVGHDLMSAYKAK